MRLKNVRLCGFKSFCDSTDFAFLQQGITTVVGPNGCGKSNVVDAVRWALGEQSPRLMRSNSMSDVIFSGSASRKPEGRAEVTLLFDNSQRTAIEKYNEFAEISVTRRLYRSGESEYLINKMPCRLMDVRELLMDTGAAGRSYSVVEQGRVEEFVTASAQERRAFMEEAAGIVRYKTKRIAAERKLEQTRQNLLRVEDVLSELNRQESALRRQMQSAQEFRALQAEVNLLKGSLTRLRHGNSARACREQEQQLEALQEDSSDVQSVLAGLDAQLAQLDLEQTRQEQALRECRGDLHRKERDIQQVETNLALQRQTVDNTRAWSAQLGQSMEESQQRLQDALAQQKAQEDEVGLLEKQAESMQLVLVRQEQDHDERRMAAQALTERVDALREQLIECHTELTGKENQQALLAERLREDEQRRGSVEERKNAARGELKRLRDDLAACRSRARASDAALASADAHLQALAAALEEQQRGLERHHEAEAETSGELLQCRSRLQSLSEIEAGHEGFGQSVRTFLDWLGDHPDQRGQLGIVAPLVDLITVPREILDWAGDYLALHLETIVIESTAALPRLAERLEELQVGGVCFLALDALPNGGEAAPSGGSNGHPALAGLLSVAPQGKALGEALFGATHLLPAGTPPHPLPRPLGEGREWLSRDGALHIDAKARVTLGKPGTPAAGVLHRRAEIAALGQQLVRLEEAERELRAKGKDLTACLLELQTQRRAGEAQARDLSLAGKELEQELAHGDRECLRIEQVCESLRREAEQFEQELGRFRQQQGELATAAVRWRDKRERLESELAASRGDQEQASAALAEAGDALTDRKVEHGRTSSRLEGLRARRMDLEREAEEAAAKREETQGALAEQRGKHEAAAESIKALTVALLTHQQAMDHLRGVERERQQGFEGFKERHGAVAEEIADARRRYERSQGKIHEVELALTAEKLRMEQFAAELAALPAAEPDAPQPADERTLEAKLSAAQARLSRMDGVNLGAPEEYEALDARLSFLRGQQADLDQAIADLEASIRRMNKESRRRFRETFEKVDQRFQALFPQIFGGGEARLVLTESDDPLLAGVDIIAQPPGKKLQNLNLLSGGEKALIAIALIFSFFLYKPSPFCLLDEVDAPLDDVNVTRFNRLIKSMTEHSQFIIITHNKRTMEVADRLYGVTMEEAGVSKIVSVNLAGQP